VGSALSVAFGLATFIQRRYPPAKAQSLLRYVAFPSAVVTSSLNCYIVRSPEITTGIPLLNAAGENMLAHVGCDDDDEVTTSRIAAAAGVYTTTASRALLQAPVYFLPPVFILYYSSGRIRRRMDEQHQIRKRSPIHMHMANTRHVMVREGGLQSLIARVSTH
jgi:Sideroflexins